MRVDRESRFNTFRSKSWFPLKIIRSISFCQNIGTETLRTTSELNCKLTLMDHTLASMKFGASSPSKLIEN